MDDELPTTPARQVPRLRLQTDNSPTQDVDYDNDLDQNTPIRSGPLMPAALDPHTPIGKTFSKTAPKDNEFRKVLSLLLENLRNRKRPPSVYDEFRGSTGRDASKIGSTLNAVRGAVRMARKSDAGDGDDSDEDRDSSVIYSTDATVEHLTQLRDVLIISEKLGWNILSGLSVSLPESDEPPSPRTPFRRRRQSFHRSESRERRRPKTDDAVQDCIDILAELIAEDCRYRIKTVRLRRPPRVLQAICLDFAQCLITNQRHNSKALVDIGLAVLPAFSTFGTELHPRLLKFFEENIIRGALETLSGVRGNKRMSLGPDLPGQHLTPMASSPTPEPKNASPFLSIKVEGPADQDPQTGWLQWSPAPSPLRMSNILSTTAPNQYLQVYQLSSLISQLLREVLEHVDWTSIHTSVNTLQRLHQLLELIVEAKPDAYLDLLEIIAYHTNQVRHPAISILVSFWPNAVGHAFVGKAFPIVSYQADLSVRDVRESRLLVDECAYSHHFVSWGFSSPRPTSQNQSFAPDPLSHGISMAGCHVCSQTIEGIGLLCTMCLCGVHLGCYDNPDGQFFTMYPAAHDSNTQKVALTRFSHVQPHRRTTKLPFIPRELHTFRPVNLFTLTLCLACSEPLWGFEGQALECSSCRQFIHPACLHRGLVNSCRSSTPSASTFTIDRATIRQSFLRHYKAIIFEEDDIPSHSYEEISVCYGIIWAQLEVVRQGIASGSLVVVEKRSSTISLKERTIEDWEIHSIVGRYERHLRSGVLLKSGTLEEYQHMAHAEGQAPGTEANLSILFDRSLLVYITALIKSPKKTPSPPQQHPSVFLTVNGNDDRQTEDLGHPFEMVSLSHMRDVLGFEFNIYSDTVAKFLLTHLHAVGFFHRLDRRTPLFDQTSKPSDTICIFPLPLVIDYSTNVETLVSAIAVCLDDLDISVNEVGFLWLTKRCWPNGMASDYAMQRLIGLIISWIVSEDDRLLRIARDYVARATPLPGVRTAVDGAGWPATATSRVGGFESSSRSGDSYLACRRELLLKYASRWMLALHDQDPDLYAQVIYDQARENAADDGHPEAMTVDSLGSDPVVNPQRYAEEADRALRAILKLCQNNVIFSAFDTVITLWLDAAVDLGGVAQSPSFPALRRLAVRDSLGAKRASTLDASSLGDAVGAFTVDPWQVVIKIASEHLEGPARAIAWIRIFALSSVSVPSSILSQLWMTIRDAPLPFTSILEFAEALFCTAWTEPSGRHELIAMVAELHTRQIQYIISQPSKSPGWPHIVRFMQFTLACCLLLYGCDRRSVTSLHLVEEKYISSLVMTKQRQSTLGTPTSAALGVDGDLMVVMARYISDGPNELRILATKFMSTLLTQPSLLAPDAANRYLTTSGERVYESAWALWDLQDDSVAALRIQLLLRLLATSPAHFGDILFATFRRVTEQEIRMQAVSRLLKIILSLNDPSLLSDGSRFSVLPIFTYFFKAIWEDQIEAVRLSAQVFAQTLLPAHFSMMSLCYEEAFLLADRPGRLELVLFLHHLLPHFPIWQVLSWRAILGAMPEEIPGRRSTLGPGDTVAIGVDAELRVALVSLSLQMLGNGVPAELEWLVGIKYHLALALGFSFAQFVDTSYGTRYIRLGQVDTPPQESFACLTGLVRALDSPLTAQLPPAAMGVIGVTDEHKNPHIGAIFVDLALSLIVSSDLQSLSYLPARSLLDALIVVIYKYDIAQPSLSHLQDQLLTAVQRITHSVNMDISYDLRSAAIIAAQSFLRKWPHTVIKILSRQIFSVCMLLTDLGLARDNLLVAQGTGFLEAAFTQFSSNGLFILLLKYPLQADFFQIIRHVMASHSKGHSADPSTPSLKEAILSDTFSKLTERPDDNFDKVLPNLKTMVEVVYHQGYSIRLIHDATAATNHLARIALDTNGVAFNPNPWLEMCIIIIRHNKSNSRDLLAALEAFLKAVAVRFDLTVECLSDLLLHTATFYHREETSKDLGLHIGAMVVDLLSDGLRGKSRLPTNTLSAMLNSIRDVVRVNEDFLPPNTLRRIAQDSAYHLYTPAQGDMYVDASFTITMLAADMVHEAAKVDLAFLRSHFANTNDRSGKGPLPVRAWNALVLAALADPSTAPSNNLFANLKTFGQTYANSLLTLSVRHAPSENSALDLNQAFTAIKLWLMACRRKRSTTVAIDAQDDIILNRSGAVSLEENEETSKERTVWNELWPPFESLLAAASAGDGSEEITPLTLSIWSSFADLVIFVHQIRSPVALEAFAIHISHLKTLKRRNKNDSANNKFSRALKSVVEPPLALPLEVLIAQARNELLAGEKLAYALERRRLGPDRGDRRQDRRRDNRTVA